METQVLISLAPFREWYRMNSNPLQQGRLVAPHAALGEMDEFSSMLENRVKDEILRLGIDVVATRFGIDCDYLTEVMSKSWPHDTILSYAFALQLPIARKLLECIEGESSTDSDKPYLYVKLTQSSREVDFCRCLRVAVELERERDEAIAAADKMLHAMTTVSPRLDEMDRHFLWDQAADFRDIQKQRQKRHDA